MAVLSFFLQNYKMQSECVLLAAFCRYSNIQNDLTHSLCSGDQIWRRSMDTPQSTVSIKVHSPQRHGREQRIWKHAI